MKGERNFLKSALVYVSLIIGAGFASGAEIMTYFVKQGKGGVLGLILSGILFSAVGIAIWRICEKFGVNSYKHFMDKVMGKYFSNIIDVFASLFMFVIFASMLAGCGAAIHEGVGLSVSSGVYISATICFIVFLFDMPGILELNEKLAPLMIVGCFGFGVYTYVFKAEDVFSAENIAGFMRKDWLISAVSYVGYNIMTAVAVLSSMKENMPKKADAIKSGVAAGLIISTIGIGLFLGLNSNFQRASSFEIPMLGLASGYGEIFETAYFLIFVIAVFTTGATNGYAVVESISSRFKINKSLLKFLIPILGCFSAFLGFSEFVANVYPLFAIVGILEMGLICVFLIRGRGRE